MWGDSLLCKQCRHRANTEVMLYIYIQIPNHISRGVLRATLITLYFVLADDLHVTTVICLNLLLDMVL